MSSVARSAARNDLYVNPQVFFVCNSFEKLGHAPKDANRHRAPMPHSSLTQGGGEFLYDLRLQVASSSINED